MADVKPKNQVMKLFLHDKPFLILRAIYYNDGHAYSASISKKVDCSYAYIVKLITLMNKLGLTSFEETKHKKTIRITIKGKKLFKALAEASSV
jgi:predicted transcriptional regulator